MLAQYQVSRESLREALRLLEVQGLVTIRRGPGGGPTVCTVDPANLGRVSLALLPPRRRHVPRSCGRPGSLAESILAERAAATPMHTPAGWRWSRTSTPAGRRPGRRRELVAAHLAFHAQVASLAENRVLEIVLQTVGQIVATTASSRPRSPAELVRRVADDHHRIAVAIDAGDDETARALMVDHIEAMALVANDQPGTRADEFIEWH